METYIVLYRDNSLKPLDAPYAFCCEADDTDHAEEQCEDAEPNRKIVWVVKTPYVVEAYEDYYLEPYFGDV
jgi:hypothetical protein